MIYQTTQAKFILFAILFFGMSAQIFAADGDLDTTFGNGGIVTTDNGSDNESISDLAVQADGKIIAIGNSPIGSPTTERTIIVCYNSDGNVDATFGTNGKVIVQSVFGGNLALQPNGKIIISGTKSDTSSNSGNVYVARLNANGSFDRQFGASDDIPVASAFVR